METYRLVVVSDPVLGALDCIIDRSIVAVEDHAGGCHKAVHPVHQPLVTHDGCEVVSGVKLG